MDLWSSYGKRLDKGNRAEIMALEEVVASISEIPMMTDPILLNQKHV